MFLVMGVVVASYFTYVFLWDNIFFYIGKLGLLFSEKPPPPNKGLKITDTVEHQDGFDITHYRLDNFSYAIHHYDKDIHKNIHNYVDYPMTLTRPLRRVVFAELRGTYGIENVTDRLKMAQGPKANFHLDNPHSCKHWDHILYEYDLEDWGVLVVVDSFGKIHEIPVGKDKPIEWDANFHLD